MHFPFSKHPGQGSSSGCNLGHSHGHSGNAVSSQLAACIKAKPADPQHGRTDNRQRQVMWRHGGNAKSSALAKHQCCDQASNTRVNVYNRATGKIQYAVVTQPATTPDPVTDRGIDDGQPDAHEQQQSGKLHAFSKSAHDQCRRNNGKSHLEGHEHGFRNSTGHRINPHAGQEQLAETTPEGIHAAAVTKGQVVTIDDPQNGHQRSNGKTLHQNGQDVFAAHHAGIEQ